MTLRTAPSSASCAARLKYPECSTDQPSLSVYGYDGSDVGGGLCSWFCCGREGRGSEANFASRRLFANLTAHRTRELTARRSPAATSVQHCFSCLQSLTENRSGRTLLRKLTLLLLGALPFPVCGADKNARRCSRTSVHFDIDLNRAQLTGLAMNRAPTADASCRACAEQGALFVRR